jgi:hypothetical protein
MQTSQTLRWPSPVLLSTSGCSQPPLELCKVLSDCARAFSSVPESTCRDGSAFQMLPDFTIRIVKLWSCGDMRRSAGDLVPYSPTSGFQGSITTMHFINHIGLCYSHNIHYIIIWHVLSKSLSIYTYGDIGRMEMDSATGSIYFGDSGVD